MTSTATDQQGKQAEWDLLTVMDMSQRWDMSEGFGYGLMIDDRGAACIAQAAGFIRGLWVSDKEQATAAAHDFMGQLRYLEGYGGTMGGDGGTYSVGDNEMDSNVPRYRVSVSHDLTFLGLSICWHAAVQKKAEEPDFDGPQLFSYLSANGTPCVSNRVPWTEAYNTWNYKFSHNGAMLYRGPAAGEVYSVHIGTPRFWSIHT